MTVRVLEGRGEPKVKLVLPAPLGARLALFAAANACDSKFFRNLLDVGLECTLLAQSASSLLLDQLTVACDVLINSECLVRYLGHLKILRWSIHPQTLVKSYLVFKVLSICLFVSRFLIS